MLPNGSKEYNVHFYWGTLKYWNVFWWHYDILATSNETMCTIITSGRFDSSLAWTARVGYNNSLTAVYHWLTRRLYQTHPKRDWDVGSEEEEKVARSEVRQCDKLVNLNLFHPKITLNVRNTRCLYAVLGRLLWKCSWLQLQVTLLKM